MKKELLAFVLVVVVFSGLAQGATPVMPVCVTSAGEASGIKDDSAWFASQVRKALEKDKALRLVACSEAVVVVTVGGELVRESEESEKADFTRRSGYRRSITTTASLSATLAVPSRKYETTLTGSHLENNMFSGFSSPAKALAGEIRRWVKDNGAIAQEAQ